MPPAYIPDRGDLVWLEFMPPTGSKQAGSCPALVISPESRNGKVGLALFYPVTSGAKGYPCEVLSPKGSGVVSVVRTDQVVEHPLGPAAHLDPRPVGGI
jgi:mRNA interferase MazF